MLTDVLVLCRALRLPAPVAEHRFAPPRRWRFDWAWLNQLVALEIEGAVWTGGRHTHGAGYLVDIEKYSEAAILGWCVVRCTPSTLASHGLDRVQRALRRARPSHHPTR